MRNSRRWTISVLTIPSRERYVTKLLESLHDSRLPTGVEVSIVYNWDTRESPIAVERRLRKAAGRLSLSVLFNPNDPSIAAGRAQQLNACKTPLICFVDDDVTIHGDLVAVLEETLRHQPVGIVGIPSLIEDSDRLFKPRRETPHVDVHGVRYMPVQGMLVAGYRRLFLDVGGFNPRRHYWGEWTELNLRMWRSGFPTAYAMNGAYLRHWHDAPESPTRNKKGRDGHILWGLLCTALEYDATEITDATQVFWKLVDDRYLAYAYDGEVSPSKVLSGLLQLTPRLSGEWTRIMEFRDMVRRHPFPFAPFHRITPDEVEQVVAHAGSHIRGYRHEIWPPRRVTAVGGWLARRVGREG